MNMSQFLPILLARKRIIFATMLVTVALTFLVSVLLPKSYNATASVLLNDKGTDPLTGIVIPSQLLPGYMATQIDIINSKNVAGRVVDRLKRASSPEVVERFRDSTGGAGTVRDWLSDLLLKNLDVVPSRESSVVEINCRGSDPRFAAGIANAFADEYQKLSVELKAEPLKKAAACFSEQTRLLRDNVEAAQSRLSTYQQERGLVSIDKRVDVGMNRLVSERAFHEVLPGGRLVATDLANDAFFLPRYDTADLVAMSDQPCPCGRGFLLIQSVIGRANDLVHDSADNAVHSEFFTHLFREDARIAAFQVLYDGRELVVIVHCPRQAPEQGAYLARIAAALHFDMIRFSVNTPFLCIANGKHRFVMRVDNAACYTAHG